MPHFRQLVTAILPLGKEGNLLGGDKHYLEDNQQVGDNLLVEDSLLDGDSQCKVRNTYKKVKKQFR
jgi:hypothetical protein